jgi:hypothetical protein
MASAVEMTIPIIDKAQLAQKKGEPYMIPIHDLGQEI